MEPSKRRKLLKTEINKTDGTLAMEEASNSSKKCIWIQMSYKLDELNDDCWQEIFNHLTPIDLVNVADACTNFSKLAKQCFMENKDHLELTEALIPNNAIRKTLADKLLLYFGEYIRSINAEAIIMESPDNFLEMMFRQCKTLRSLDLNGFTFHPQYCLPFKHLQYLELTRCRFNFNTDHILHMCTNLKSLQFLECKTNIPCIGRNFKNLEEIAIKASSLDETSLNAFIVLNPKLKKFTFFFSGDLSSFHALKLIGNNMPNLTELDFRYNAFLTSLYDVDLYDNAIYLSRLKMLTVLKMDFCRSLITPVMKALADNQIPIEELRLYNIILNNYAIDYITKMKTIEVFVIARCKEINDYALTQLGMRLPQLSAVSLSEVKRGPNINALKIMLPYARKLCKLQLTWVKNMKINQDDYINLVNTIKYRRNPLNLYIDIINPNENIVTVPNNVLNDKQNKDFVNIHVTHHRKYTVLPVDILVLPDHESYY